MNHALSPRDVLEAANKRVFQEKEKLHSASEQARRARSRADWLAERPDLLALERLIQEIPIRQEALQAAWKEYNAASEDRLQEAIQRRAIVPPELEDEIARYQWLHRQVSSSPDEHSLTSLLSDARLDDANRGIITARVEALRTGGGWISFSGILSEDDSEPGFYLGHTHACWARYSWLVGERLRSLEKKRDELLRDYLPTIRSEVEALLGELKKRVGDALRAFSKAKAAASRRLEIDLFVDRRIESFVAEQTREQRAAYDEAVRSAQEARSLCVSRFRRRLEEDFGVCRIEDFAPEDDHALHRQLEGLRAKRVQQLEELRAKNIRDMQEAENRAWWVQVSGRPIGEVIERLDDVPHEHVDAVLGLLLRLPADDPHILNDKLHGFLSREHSRLARSKRAAAPVVIAHIGHLVATGDFPRARILLSLFPARLRSALDGVVAYLRFVTEDGPVLSGVTHYRTLRPEDVFLGACYYGDCDNKIAYSTLAEQTRWDYTWINELLSASGGAALNDFKVAGLQPRIAELAFDTVYRRLAGSGTRDALCDLNLERVRQLGQRWCLVPRPELPSVDWEDDDGRRYDVKCNLYYRSKQAKLGLRGFLIKRPSTCRTFPGFLFTGSDDESCEWVYVGEYHPTPTSAASDGRMLPFLFRVPDSQRFTLPKFDWDPQDGIPLLCNRWLRIGWQLATGMDRPLNPQGSSVPYLLLHAVVQQCVTRPADTPLETALWEALTTVTFTACGEHPYEHIESFLQNAGSLISDRAFPVRLPKVGPAPILSRWIAEVLQPLAVHWQQIRWNPCRNCGLIAGTPELHINRMTAGGSILGRIVCKGCRVVIIDDVTLLTHCHRKGCGNYPLLIGKNDFCADCRGLICGYECGESGRCCACKSTCGKASHVSGLR